MNSIWRQEVQGQNKHDRLQETLRVSDVRRHKYGPNLFVNLFGETGGLLEELVELTPPSTSTYECIPPYTSTRAWRPRVCECPSARAPRARGFVGSAVEAPNTMILV